MGLDWMEKGRSASRHDSLEDVFSLRLSCKHSRWITKTVSSNVLAVLEYFLVFIHPSSDLPIHLSITIVLD